MQTYAIILVVIGVLITCFVAIFIVLKFFKKGSLSSSEVLQRINYHDQAIANVTEPNTVKRNLNNTHIFFINMERSKDRRKYISTQVNKFKLTNAHIFPATDGLKITNRNRGVVEGVKFENNDLECSRGEIACTISHLRVIQKIYEDNLDYALVLEDDVSLYQVSLWEFSLEDYLQNAPDNWEFISLYFSCNRKLKNGKRFVPYSKNDCWGSVAYVINRKGAAKIVSECVAQDGTFILDREKVPYKRTYSDRYIPEQLYSYNYYESLFYPRNNKEELNSTIHTEHTKGHIETQLKIMKNYYQKVVKNSREIPKIIHLIWIGPKKPPHTLQSWTIDFQEYYPDWVVKIWRDEDIDKLDLYNKSLYNKMTEYCGKADIARYEILYRFGGVYVDADTVWLNPIDPQLLSGRLNFVRENDTCIANGWIAATRKHTFLYMLIKNMKKTFDATKQAWITVGPRYVHETYSLYEDFIDPDDIVFHDDKDVMCPPNKEDKGGWHGITENNYDDLLQKCRSTSAFLFHYGISTNNLDVNKK